MWYVRVSCRTLPLEERRWGPRTLLLLTVFFLHLMGSNKRDRLWTPGFPIHKIYVTNQFLVLQPLDGPKSIDEK